MGDHIIGIKKLNEISATVKGANEHATKVFCKSFAAPKTAPTPTPKTEPTEPEMDMNILKSALLLTDAGKAYVATLEEEKMKSFFSLDKAAQDAEVTAWETAEKAKSEAAAAEETAKTGVDPAVAALQARIDELESERNVEKSAATTRDIEKRAEKEFPGVPHAVTILKSIAKFPPEEQAPHIELLKSQQKLSRTFAKTYGDDEAKAGGDATAAYENAAAEVAKEKKITKSQAKADMAGDPQYTEVIKNYRLELQG